MTAVATPAYWRGLPDVPGNWGRSVVTLGVFDGLHRGHAHLLARAVELGDRRGLPVVLVTFDPHPATVAGPRRDTAPLTSIDRRARLARRHRADAVLVLPFTTVTARTPAVDFALDVLVRALRATDVVVGTDFRFGDRGVGDVTLLRRLGARHRFHTHAVELLPGCSSTQVRRLLAAGDVGGAADVLGRPHQIDGPAIDGRITVDPGATLPAPGTYEVLVGTSRRLAVVTDGEVRIAGTHGQVAVRFLAARDHASTPGAAAAVGLR